MIRRSAIEDVGLLDENMFMYAEEMDWCYRLGRAGWLLDDAVRLEAAVPLTAQALMLTVGEALEAHRSTPPPPRGAFVHPDDIL